MTPFDIICRLEFEIVDEIKNMMKDLLEIA
jgi:hypothetical protein